MATRIGLHGNRSSPRLFLLASATDIRRNVQLLAANQGGLLFRNLILRNADKIFNDRTPNVAFARCLLAGAGLRVALPDLVLKLCLLALLGTC